MYSLLTSITNPQAVTRNEHTPAHTHIHTCAQEKTNHPIDDTHPFPPIIELLVKQFRDRCSRRATPAAANKKPEEQQERRYTSGESRAIDDVEGRRRVSAVGAGRFFGERRKNETDERERETATVLGARVCES